MIGRGIDGLGQIHGVQQSTIHAKLHLRFVPIKLPHMERLAPGFHTVVAAFARKLVERRARILPLRLAWLVAGPCGVGKQQTLEVLHDVDLAATGPWARAAHTPECWPQTIAHLNAAAHLHATVGEGEGALGGQTGAGIVSGFATGAPVGAAGHEVGIGHALVRGLDDQQAALAARVLRAIPLQLLIAHEAFLVSPLRRIRCAIGVEAVLEDQFHAFFGISRLLLGGLAAAGELREHRLATIQHGVQWRKLGRGCADRLQDGLQHGLIVELALLAVQRCKANHHQIVLGHHVQALLAQARGHEDLRRLGRIAREPPCESVLRVGGAALEALRKQFGLQHLLGGAIGLHHRTLVQHPLAELGPLLRAHRCAARKLRLILLVATNARHLHADGVEQVGGVPLPQRVGLHASLLQTALEKLAEGVVVVAAVAELLAGVADRGRFHTLLEVVLARGGQRAQCRDAPRLASSRADHVGAVLGVGLQAA